MPPSDLFHHLADCPSGDCYWCGRNGDMLHPKLRFCTDCLMVYSPLSWDLEYGVAFEGRTWDIYNARPGGGNEKYTHHLVMIYSHFRDLHQFKHLTDDALSDGIKRYGSTKQQVKRFEPYLYDREETLRRLWKNIGFTCATCSVVEIGNHYIYGGLLEQ